MKKKSLLSILAINLLVMSFFFFLCTSPTKAPEKPRLAPIADTSVFAGDTIRLSVASLFAPQTISGYLWSLNGGKTFSDTTRTNSIICSWDESETGKHDIAVKVFDSRNIVSDSIAFHVSVVICKPVLSIIADTVADINAPTSLSIVDSSACGHIRYYLWSYDGGLTYTDTTQGNGAIKQWEKTDTGKTIHIVARAKIESGSLSQPAIFTIRVGACHPTIVIRGDKVAYLNDSARFFISTESPCAITDYLWSFDNDGFFTDTTFNPSFVKQWQSGSDTGIHIVLAAAQTASGTRSFIDSFRVVVRTGDFSVALPHDTTVSVNDSLFVVAFTQLAHSTISHFLWTVDQDPRTIFTEQDTLAVLWTPDQSGIHRISVRAYDSQGHYSTSNLMTVTVAEVKPALVVPHDTLIRAKDTFIAVVNVPSGGRIVRYLWNLGGFSWTDSGASARRKIWRQGKDSMSVLVGARDDRGVLGIDSFHLYFNAPPANLRMLSPGSGDTVCFRTADSGFARGIVPFSFSASDQNGPSDTLTYRLCLGKSLNSLDTVYKGRNSSCSSSRLDTGVYVWKLAAWDRIGDSALLSGSFVCFQQQTICFAGHSIIVGVGCDREIDGTGGTGGIRAKVLSELRKRRGGSNLSIKSVGPLPTGYLTDKKDDSCFAVSQYKAMDLLTLMRNNFPRLTADMWVVMLGVNGQYSIDYGYNELRNIVTMLDDINRNNPLASTYVINGLPNEQYSGRDTIFNKSLADSVRARLTQNPNRKLKVIDAYKIFSINNAPDSSLFSLPTPYLHPNQRGYDSLAQAVLDAMKTSP